MDGDKQHRLFVKLEVEMCARPYPDFDGLKEYVVIPVDSIAYIRPDYESPCSIVGVKAGRGGTDHSFHIKHSVSEIYDAIMKVQHG